MKGKKQLGTALATSRSRNTWVQTERAAHEAWARLMADAPAAARLAHVLVAHMGPDNAVVASRATLAELMGVSVATIKRSAAVLAREQWIQIIQLGGKGGANAYVIEDRIAWSGPREQRPSVVGFRAAVIAARGEQSREELAAEKPLRRIPVIQRGEIPLPGGPGLSPPSQPSLPGLEPVLYRDAEGRHYEIDRETGEVQQTFAALLSDASERKPEQRGAKPKRKRDPVRRVNTKGR